MGDGMTREQYADATRDLPKAEAIHGGALRGGYTDGETFFYCSRGFNRVPVEAVRDLAKLPTA